MNDGRTHWVGCHAEPGHHECAIARVAELEKLLAASVRQYDELNEEYHGETARVAELEQNVKEAVDGWHMANGVAVLAMKHRDMAERRVAELEQAIRDAPHSHWCCIHGNGTSVLTDEFCNCWKRHVLKVVEDA